MRQSQLFTKTRREAPADEVSKNAVLLTRAGFINKQMAGVYSYLPLGWLVIQKIRKIVAEEMKKLGSVEFLISSLQEKEVWEKTNRWSDDEVDVWFKSELKNGTQVGFGWSHEEPITELMVSHVGSFRDLPRYVHQFQNKMRNEARAKSGIMRCREFLMKDMYSYSRSEEEHVNFYNKAIDAYLNVFRRVGLGDITYVTSASGGVFTDKFSHEFQTICEAGEDTIYVTDESKRIATNAEVSTEGVLKKAAEVGNIFTFGTKKCEQLGLYFTDERGEKMAVYLGSYGIGITRLMGVLAEVFGDEKGLVWPEEVAPFKYHLISLTEGSKETADKIYQDLVSRGVELLYDDRNLRAGEKLNDADLIGIPKQIIVGDKTDKDTVELKDRSTGNVSKVKINEIIG